MKTFVLFVFLFLLSGSLFAQTVYSRIDNLRLYEDCFMWDIQMKRTDEWPVPVLGHHDFYFFINADAFSNIQPVIEWIHPDLDGNASYSIRTGYAADESQCWVALDYTYNPDGQGFYPSPIDQYTRVLSISLPFPENPSGNTGVDWHTTSTAGTDSSLNPLLQTLEGSGNVAIDIKLTILNAALKDNKVYIRWRTESERSVSGYHLSRQDDDEHLRINKTLIPAQGGAATSAEYLFIDSEVKADKSYIYKLVQVDLNGNESEAGTVGIRTDAWVPQHYFLDSNYPNPFNPSTTIKFGLPEQTKVVLDIFNIRGEKICRLSDQIMSAGIHSVEWDGTNMIGRQVSSGVYFYKLKAGTYQKISKMLLAR